MLEKIPKKYFPLLAIAGLLLICLLFFHQLLFSGEIINATDILTQQYFWNLFIKENLFADPSFRTWLPYINAGTPFSGGLNLLFRPVSFFTLLLLPVHIAINYEIVIYLFLMGVGMYFYMRELQISHIGAFLAAIFLMLNGEIVSLINAGHVNKIGAIFPVTFVFFTLERALRRKTLTAFLLAGFALGFQFWEGHIQISFYICIAVGLYYLIRVGFLYRQNRNLKQISIMTVFAILMVMLFLFLSAVEFLPLLSFAQVSERAQGVSYEFATSWSMPPEELATYLIPGFFGFRRLNYIEDENIIPYWGRMPFTQTGRYFGLLPLLFMLLAFCFVRNKYVLTLSVIAVVVLLLGMGKYIPTYKLLYTYVPGFNMFRVPQSILFLFAFAASGLAGFGAEWLCSDFSGAKEKRLRIFLLVCIAIFL
ncbi:MAG: YfhO family protein, partial [Deltaproteobacteria bacterium]|nr:YfhO family protein [Deltaproteobacteria bacterium]